MERYVVLVFTLLCIYVIFSYAEETKEETISVSRLESQPNRINICVDGTVCRSKKCCPRNPSRTRFGCCSIGERAICCPDLVSCCPVGFICDIHRQLCIRPGYSSVLQVQAIPLVKIIDKRCREGTAGMDPKVNRVTPSQQAEQASKKTGVIGTSGDVFSPDEKHQCADGTTICELSPGIYGCCPIENARRRMSNNILPWWKVLLHVSDMQSGARWKPWLLFVINLETNSEDKLILNGKRIFFFFI